jgi:hypothetical protein
MHVFSTFEHSSFLELAISDLEQKGITRDRILAVPMSRLGEERQLFDTIHRADGDSLLDGAAMLGTVFMLLGVMWGFLWKYGPILGGLTGFALGALIGFAVDYLTSKKVREKDKVKNLTTEVILIINCQQEEVKTVEGVLWEHLATSIGRVKRSLE